jgi:hypothetical protein
LGEVLGGRGLSMPAESYENLHGFVGELGGAMAPIPGNRLDSSVKPVHGLEHLFEHVCEARDGLKL